MKLRSPSARATSGFTLIELLSYIAIVGLVMSLATVTLVKLIGHTTDLRRNCDDIAAAVHAGEIWRADIRAASGSPVIRSGNEGSLFTIPTEKGRIRYSLEENTIWRQAGDGAPNEPLLRNTRAAGMLAVQRDNLPVWRWELELAVRREGGPIKPLFSFIAVAPNVTQP